MLANGDEGDGRMPDEAVLFQHILKETAFEKDLSGKKILVTAGATRESIDPVRFITNHSSGKMGRAIARARRFQRRRSDFYLRPYGRGASYVCQKNSCPVGSRYV